MVTSESAYSMTDRLSRSRSAMLCSTFFLASTIILSMIPVVGVFLSAVDTFSSPIVWMEAYIMQYCAASYVGQPPPRHVMMLLEAMRHPAFAYVRFAGPFLVYGLIVGFAFPCESGSNAQFVKSVAIRFVLTLLAVSLVAICVGMFAAGYDPNWAYLFVTTAETSDSRISIRPGLTNALPTFVH
jgi:uncharacterized membrane protein